MLLAAHMSMQNHFDMDELFEHLISPHGNANKSKAFVRLRAFESNQRNRKSFFIVFRYFTIVGDGLSPAPWQFHNNQASRTSPDQLEITECSSILGISLTGECTKRMNLKTRNPRRRRVGELYDTNAPWHVLSIQFFPDDESSVSHNYPGETFCNGPHAFLVRLSMEYQDAVRRYTRLNERISKLITPPSQFVFDSKLRERFLFEDKYFTYSRRYFWAYNTLAVLNESIQAMRNTYLETFTDDFWVARHVTVWPHPDPESLEGKAYIARLLPLRERLDASMKDLQRLCDQNEKTRELINSLRQQLHSGSAEKKSQKAIEQGNNIKILTSVSMIFLPLTFVTSVFGMTNFEFDDRDWRFIAIMVAVCVPFFLLIFVLQTHKALRRVCRKTWKMFRQTRTSSRMGLSVKMLGRLLRLLSWTWGNFRKLRAFYAKQQARTVPEHGDEMV